jgi:hypothetical protein
MTRMRAQFQEMLWSLMRTSSFERWQSKWTWFYSIVKFLFLDSAMLSSIASNVRHWRMRSWTASRSLILLAFFRARNNELTEDTTSLEVKHRDCIPIQISFHLVLEWFAERVDRIILLFDAHKLDISDEFKRCIEALAGRLSQGNYSNAIL